MTATIQQVCDARIAMNEKKLGKWPGGDRDWYVEIVEELLDAINYSVAQSYRMGEYVKDAAGEIINIIVEYDPTVLDRALARAQQQKDENDAWVDMQAEKFERMKEMVREAHSPDKSGDRNRVLDLVKENRELNKMYEEIRAANFDLAQKNADLDKELADKQLAIEYMTSRLAAKADLVEKIRQRITILPKHSAEMMSDVKRFIEEAAK